jgi:transcriptional regulator with XRE-family HTH domain/tetratricopeptide (TPR) repeat protein
MMSEYASFGAWVAHRRKILDLTQQDFAQRVQCAVVTIRKIESDERRPSKQLAELMATHLRIPAEQRDSFINAARAQRATLHLEDPAQLTTTLNTLPTPIKVFTATLDSHDDLLRERAALLIGRNAELDMIRTALECRQHVLLQGSGGMGKTSLAAEAATHFLNSEQRTVFWVRMGEHDPNAILEAVQRYFEQPYRLGVSLAERQHMVRQMLSEVGIVVLDDVWNGNALFEVFKALPISVPTIITSRLSFSITNAITVSVRELDAESSLALMKEHSGDCAALPEALELCQDLGNHPYAIEIAARTLGAQRLTPSELRLLIADRPADLKVPGEFAEEGRESVAALLNASLSRLGTDERRVFSSFGDAFAPSLTTSLLAILRNETDTIKLERALLQLQAHGLLERVAASETHASYYRLHSLTHSYARTLKKRTNRTLIVAIEACRDFAATNSGDYNRLEAERGNLLGAAETAMHLGESALLIDILSSLAVRGIYFDARGHDSQSLALLNAAIEAAEVNELHQEAHFLLAKLGNTYMNHIGDFDYALQAYQQSLELARLLENTNREALLLSIIGMVRFRQNEPDAKAYLDQAYTLAVANADDKALSVILQHLSHYAMMNLPPDYESGWQFADQAISVATRMENNEARFTAMINRGGCELELSRVTEAIATHQSAYDFAVKSGHRDWQGIALHSLGEDYNILGDRNQARTHLEKALTLFREIRAEGRVRALAEFMQQNGYPVD